MCDQIALHKTQIERGDAIVRALQVMRVQVIITTVMAAIMLVVVALTQLRIEKTLSMLAEINNKNAVLQSGYESLNRKFDERLKTSTADISRQVQTLQDRVDESPKVVSNEKGEIKLAVPLAPKHPKQPVKNGPAPSAELPPTVVVVPVPQPSAKH